MKTAIIGAGLSGLSLAWYLSSRSSAKITLFDPFPLAENASGLAAGLLHPFARPQARLPTQVKDGLAASLELLKAVSQTLEKPVYHKTGMLRPAFNEEQIMAFKECAAHHADVAWLEAETVQQKVEGIVKKPGLWIETAYQVDMPSYLLGLWKGCEERGVTWDKKEIKTLEECAHFDKIIVATGASLLPELSQLPIHPVKGQLLYLKWDKILPAPVNGPVYLLQPKGKEETGLTLLGSTFEHGFDSLKPDLESALTYLFPRFQTLFPSIEEKDLRSIIVECKAGVRGTAPMHRPLIQQISSKVWYLGGMGSKGLLYHALYAKEMCKMISFP